MFTAFKKLLIPGLILFSICFVLILINQLSGLYIVLSDFNPLIAKIVTGSLAILVSGLALTPLFVLWKLPKAIKRPQSESEVPNYQKQLLSRLQTNAILKASGSPLKSTEDLKNAVGVLDAEADKIINETASVVFLTTSISQNGKLDALTVFATQIRMIWKIAHLYYQRPGLSDLGYLYANVGATAFVSSEIEDVDLSQQLEPIVSALFKNAGSRSVPFLGNASQVILDSLLEGSTNAFLTLRVGILAKRYCGATGVLDKKGLKKSAFKEAASMLTKVTAKSAGRIVTTLLNATKKAGLDTVKSSWEGVKNAGEKIRDSVSSPFRKPESKSTNSD